MTEPKKEKHHGKQTKQRMKPYIVLQYLLRNSDEDNVVTGKEIEGYLQETCKIYAERRSIYKDIEEIIIVSNISNTLVRKIISSCYSKNSKWNWVAQLYLKRFHSIPKEVAAVKKDIDDAQNIYDQYLEWEKTSVPFHVTELVGNKETITYYSLNDKLKFKKTMQFFSDDACKSEVFNESGLKDLLALIKDKLQCNTVVMETTNMFNEKLIITNIYIDGKQLNFMEQARLLSNYEHLNESHIVKFMLPKLFADTYELPSIDELVHLTYELNDGVSEYDQVQRQGFMLHNYEKNISFRIINPAWVMSQI